MQDSQQNKKVTQNPLKNQLKILKQKLDQRGNDIVQLTKQLTLERSSMLNLVSQFEKHQLRLMDRLKKIESVTMKYIKQYIDLKNFPVFDQINRIEPFFNNPANQLLLKKLTYYKEYFQEEIVETPKTDSSTAEKTINNCCHLIKSYLVEKQLKYDKIVKILSDNRKKHLKEAKGLDAYKSSKQQQKKIDYIKQKNKNLNKLIQYIDTSNMVQIFNIQAEITRQINLFDPTEGIQLIPDNAQEQQILQKLIEQIIMINIEENPVEDISEKFLNCQFTSLQNSLTSLVEEYGHQFVQNIINQIDNISPETKYAIIMNYNRKDLMSIIKKEKKIPDNYKEERQKMRKNRESFSSDQPDKKQHQKGINPPIQQTIEQKYQQMEQYVSRRFESVQLRPKEWKQNKLNNAFEVTMNKSFFQQQQVKRNQLVSKQNNELEQHKKVIEKLITFIRKEFKQKKIEQIEGDDPNNLMEYYLRVSQKKYMGVKTEMEELQIQKKLVIKEREKYIYQNHVLQQSNKLLLNDNSELQQQKINLQYQKIDLIDQKTKLIQKLQGQKQRIQILQVQNNNLQLQLQLQKLQIVALSEVYQKIKSNTIEFHYITSKTQNIVKLSLETLFNTCTNQLTPEELIERLESIIQLIKINVKLKSDITYELTVQKYITKQEQRAKQDFVVKISSEILSNKTNEIRRSKSELVLEGMDKSLIQQIQQKPKNFASNLKALATQIMQKSLIKSDPTQSNELALQTDKQNGSRQDLVIEISQTQLKQQNQQIVISPVMFGPFMSSFNQLKNDQSYSSQNSQQNGRGIGIDQNFIAFMMEKISEMKNRNSNDFDINQNFEDINQMYKKYKQAVDCLERAEKLNQSNQMKYQTFLNDLKKKGAKDSPQLMEEKLFYMEKLIKTQNQLLESQRKEYEETILKQLEKSEELAKDVMRSIKLKRKQTIR